MHFFPVYMSANLVLMDLSGVQLFNYYGDLRAMTVYTENDISKTRLSNTYGMVEREMNWLINELKEAYYAAT